MAVCRVNQPAAPGRLPCRPAARWASSRRWTSPSRARERPGEPGRVDDLLMAHHQGMSLVALAVVLPIQHRGAGRACDALMHGAAVVRLLLHEAPPREAPLLASCVAAAAAAPVARRAHLADGGRAAGRPGAPGRSHAGQRPLQRGPARMAGGGWSRWQGVGDQPLAGRRCAARPARCCGF